MSDAKENEEAGQGVPSAVEENQQQLVDAQVEVQPEVASAPVTIEETSKNVENGSNHVESGSSHVESGSSHVEREKAEPPAEDENVKPEAVSEGIPQEDVQDALHSVPVEADAQALNTTECEAASDAKMEAKELPQSNEGIENDDNVCQTTVGDAEAAVEVKPEVFKATDSKTCDTGDPMPLSHNDPTTPQPAPVDTKPEVKNVLEVENKANEKQAAEPADNGNSSSKNMFFLDADHSYDGNESGTEEEQSAFMKELENFFRERSMEFKPPKFYGEGLNCLK